MKPFSFRTMLLGMIILLVSAMTWAQTPSSNVSGDQSHPRRLSADSVEFSFQPDDYARSESRKSLRDTRTRGVKRTEARPESTSARSIVEGQQHLQFVIEGASATKDRLSEHQTVTRYYVEFAAGSKVRLQQGRLEAIKMFSPEGRETDYSAHPGWRALLNNLETKGARWKFVRRGSTEQQLVEGWRRTEQYWKEISPDPRTMFYLDMNEPLSHSEFEALASLPMVEIAYQRGENRAGSSEERKQVGTDTSPLTADSSVVAAATSNAQWITTLEISDIWAYTGITGRDAHIAILSQGIPDPTGLPAIGKIGNFGLAPTAGDNVRFSVAAQGAPHAALYAVSADDPQDGQVGPDNIAEGIRAAIGANLPKGTILAIPWHYLLCYVDLSTNRCNPNRPTYNAPVEVIYEEFQAIKEAVASGFIVFEAAGNSNIDLTVLGQLLQTDGLGGLFTHKPLLTDIGSTFVGQGPYQNLGTHYSAPGITAEDSTTGVVMFGAVAAHVQSAVRHLHYSSDQKTFSPLGAIEMRGIGTSRELRFGLRKIKSALRTREPSRSIRQQTALPDGRPLRYGEVDTLPPFTRAENARIVSYAYYNDGSQDLKINNFTLFVTKGPDENACNWGTAGGPPADETLKTGEAKIFKFTIQPAEPGSYECLLVVDTDDPAIPLIDVNGTKLRLLNLYVKFQAPDVVGTFMDVEYSTVNAPFVSGSTLDFGNLPWKSATALRKFSERVLLIKNRETSQQDLVLNPIGFTRSEPDIEVLYSGGFLPEGVVDGWIDATKGTFKARIAPGETGYLKLKVHQNIDLNGSFYKDLLQSFVMHTNDTRSQTFNFSVQARVSQQEKWFDFFGLNIYNASRIPLSTGEGEDYVVKYDLGAVNINELRHIFWNGVKSFFLVEIRKDSAFASFKDFSDKLNRAIPETVPGNPAIPGDAAAIKIGSLEDFSAQVTLVRSAIIGTELIDQYIQEGKRARSVIQMRADKNGETRYYYLVVNARPWKNGPGGIRYLGIDFNPNSPNGSVVGASLAEQEIKIGSNVNLGKAALNKPVARHFKIYNDNNAVVYLSDIRLDGDGLLYKLSSTSIGPRSYAEVTIIMSADTAGPVKGSFSFDVDTDPASFVERTFTVDLTGEVCTGAGCETPCEVSCGPGGQPKLEYLKQDGTRIEIPLAGQVDLWNETKTDGSRVDYANLVLSNVGNNTLAIENFTVEHSNGFTTSWTSPAMSLLPGSSSMFTLNRIDQNQLVRRHAAIKFDYRDAAGVKKAFVGFVMVGPETTQPISDLTIRIENLNGTQVPWGLLNPDGSIPPAKLDPAFGAFNFGDVSFGGVNLDREIYIKNTSARPIRVRAQWTGDERSGLSPLNQSPFYHHDWDITNGTYVLQPGERRMSFIGFRSPILYQHDGCADCGPFDPARDGAAFVAFGEVDGVAGQGNVAWMPMKARIIDGPYAVVDFVNPHEVKYQDIWMKPTAINKERKLALAIYNYGNKNLSISNFKITGTGFTVTQPRSYTIPARGWPDEVHKQIFQITYKGSSIGEKIGTLTFTTNGVLKTYSLKIHIDVKQSQTGKVRVVQGQETLVNNGTFDPTGSPLFTVFNDGTQALQLGDLTVTGDLAIAQDISSTVLPGGSGQFQIRTTNEETLDEPTISFTTSDEEDDEFFFLGNSKPIAQDDTAAVSPNEVIDIVVTENDYDLDGDPVSLVTTNPFIVLPTVGSVVRLNETTIRYTARTTPGADTLQYEIGDSNGRRARAWVTINIGTNRKPVAEPDQASTDINTAVQIDVANNDWDPDGEVPVLVSEPVITPPGHGTALKVGPYSILYTPAQGFAGEDTFEYEVGDGRGMRARAWVAIQVGAANNRPTAVNDVVNIDADATVSINVTANDSDPDGDQVLLIAEPIVVSPDQGGSVTRVSSSNLSYTPAKSFTGTETFTYEIGDGRGARARAVVTVNVGQLNTPPAAQPDSVTTQVNTPVQIDVVANDTDPNGDSLTLITQPIYAPPSNGTAARVSGTTIAYTPKTNYVGTDTFTYEIGDGRGGRSRATVTVTVVNNNRVPVVVNDSAAVDPGATVRINVVANDSDPDGDVLRLSAEPIVGLPAHGAAVRVSNTEIDYTAQSSFSGTDRFQYQVADGRGGRTTGTVTITVRAGNHPPVAVNDVAHLATGVGADINVIANDSDPDGNVVRLAVGPDAIVGLPTRGTLLRISDSTLRYTPETTFVGTDSFRYAIIDGLGGQAVGTVNVVVGENSKPVAQPDLATVNKGQTIQINVTANDSDPDGDAVLLITSPVITAPTKGAATRVSSSTISYTPNATYVGSDSFTYEIGDSHGGRARAVVTVSVVDPTNKPPVAVNDAAAVQSPNSVSINPLTNDSDPDGNTIALSSTPIVVEPSNGVATVASGLITYSPAANFSGTDSFTYEIADSKGAKARANVFVTVTSTEDPNAHAPIARPDAAATRRNSGTSIEVTWNDSDPDGDRVVISNPVVVAPNFGQVVKLSDTTLRFTPFDNIGTAVWTYEITDGKGNRAQSTVTVNVGEAQPSPENRAPIATADSVGLVVGTGSLDIPVTANDGDYDGDQIRLTWFPITVPPQHGSVVRLSDSTIQYTPVAGYMGSDSFEYEIQDSRLAKSKAIVTVRMHRAPIAVNDAASTFIDAPVTVNVTANDSDPDGDAVKFIWPLVTAPRYGALVQYVSTTSLKYTPPPGAFGADTFTYQIQDANGATATATVTINIQSRAPSGVQDAATVLSNVASAASFVDINLTANDTDPEGHAIKLSYPPMASPTPVGATVTRLSDSTIRYTPKVNFVGTETLTYNMEDSVGTKGTGTVVITVVNRAPLAINDSATTANSTAVAINLLANDSDPEGHALSLPANPFATQPTRGTVSRTSATSVTYTPSASAVGSDNFTYIVADSKGTTATAIVTITIGNRPPVAVADSVSMAGSGTVEIPVTANDYDPDGTPVKLAHWAPIATAPANGTAAMWTYWSINYTPRACFVGTDTFQYNLFDDKDVSVGTVTVNVANDHKPAAVNDAVVISGGYGNFNVVANDCDPDGTIPTLDPNNYLVQPPAHGTVTIYGDLTYRSLVYRPVVGYSGPDSFQYKVKDATGNYSAPATVNVNVQ